MQYNIYRVTSEGQTKIAKAASKGEAQRIARQFHEEARADGCTVVRTALRRFVARIVTETTFNGKTVQVPPKKLYAYEPLATNTHDGVCLSWSINRGGQRIAILAALAVDETQEIVYAREKAA